MKIICAGLGKTGTKSISKALRHLGFTVFDFEEQVFDFLDHWVDVFQNGAEPDVKRLYQDVDAVVDAPGNIFWEEILEAFPDSQVILSERDEDSWLKSLTNQLEVLYSVPKYQRFYRTILSPTSRKMAFVINSSLNSALGTSNQKSTCVIRKRYRAHNHRVKSLVPPEKLLVYNVNEGWKPLCDFLGCEVPTAAFPHENVKGEYFKLPLSATRYGQQCIWEIQMAVFVILSVIVAIIATFLVIFYNYL